VKFSSEGKRKVLPGLRFADTPQDDDIVGMSGGWSVADYNLEKELKAKAKSQWPTAGF